MCSLLTACCDRTADQTRSERCFFLPFYFSLFLKGFPVCARGMDAATRFATLARLDLPFYEYAREFCKLVVATALDDATLNKLFWLGANHHRSVDLPDTTGLSWREGVFRCLGSVRARARTSPLSFAAPASPPPAGKAMPPTAAIARPPPFAAYSSPQPVSMASPPAVHVASLPVAAPSKPEPTPRQRLPVPAPQKRYAVPAPPERPPVPAPRMRLAVPAPPERPPVPAPRMRLAVPAPPECPPVPAPRKRYAESALPERPQVPDRAPTFLKEIFWGGSRAPAGEAGAGAGAASSEAVSPWPPESPDPTSHSNRAEVRKLQRIRLPGSFHNWRRFTENYRCFS